MVDMDKLCKQLERHEGFRSSAYQDSLGFWTIGIGRMIDARRSGGITREEARFLLLNDIDKCYQQLDVSFTWFRYLDEVRQRVLINMCFNMGITTLKSFVNTMIAVKEHRYQDAATGMLNSKWATQVGARAVELAEMMRTGVDKEV